MPIMRRNDIDSDENLPAIKKIIPGYLLLNIMASISLSSEFEITFRNRRNIVIIAPRAILPSTRCMLKMRNKILQ